ncbi:30S ribosomal protein S18 [Candidatus Poriferisodalis sp.]|uniref:30S ribosomal protein S18 n=1 Tax=Candidatus Poriferisodalis sp. TaxID=3101277 RepID=UPI003B014D9E
MPPRKRTGRARPKELRGRPRRRKVSPLQTARTSYVDYKDVELLRVFISERAKIRAQRVSGNNRHQQRDVARAIKTAREMALIEYARRPMTQRRGDKRRGGRGPDDRGSGDRRPPSDRAEGDHAEIGESDEPMVAVAATEED